MLNRYSGQDRLSFRGQLDQNAATIVRILMPLDQSACDRAIHQLNGAVMLDQQPIGDVANSGWLLGAGEAAQGEQELVLLRLEPDGMRGTLAKGEESPELQAESGKRVVIERMQGWGGTWQYRRFYRVTIQFRNLPPPTINMMGQLAGVIGRTFHRSSRSRCSSSTSPGVASRSER